MKHKKKKTTKARMPTASEIRRIAEYYDKQSDEEGAIEIQNAPLVTGDVWVQVPEELLPKVRKLLARYRKSA
jgi:hypothetical protein